MTVDPDGAAARLVRDAIEHHLAEALRLSGQMPVAGDKWPTARHAQAEWHFFRAQLLRAVPLADAAAAVREQALEAVRQSGYALKNSPEGTKR